ncbi:phage tail protein [Photorhabdus luminescens]|uniref:Phage tail collar domain-containing protein n=1 Tax=Photorhabdus akhurstii TaxID=171438 RepID=A0ABX8LVM7_9GAMM|nr:hypothetical protein B0X70_14695 [Photorhabdus akhurstii]UJD76079.1 phage tail protein [Photorhabdus luminescens]
MARKDSFNKTWASNPAQFEKPGDALIERGWAGGASEDPPEAKWENWWHNRLDEALLEIQNSGALAWFPDAKYTKGALVNYGGKNWVALSASSNISPNGPLDNGIWLEVEYSKSDFLKKSQNGADIPDKNAFVKNLGLVEAVERANNAVPNSRKINGKALTGDVSLSAGDVGAFPSLPAGQLQNGGKFSDCRECGFYHVFGVNVDTVADFPRYSTSQPLYSYGVLEVYREGPLISQRYTTHFGEIAVRQAFPGNEVLKDWIIHSQHASDLLYNNIPVGVPMPYPHRYTPVGYLTCNGQTFDKSLYPKLAEAYPAGRVPDLRGEFIRGWDDSRGVDPGRVCGTWQGDAIRNITGGFVGGSWDNPTGAFYRTIAIKSYTNYASNDKDLSYINFDASRVVPVASENRPRNIAFNYIVRAI